MVITPSPPGVLLIVDLSGIGIFLDHTFLHRGLKYLGPPFLP
jgi:hypothetical protein